MYYRSCNKFNWFALIRSIYVFVNPIQFFIAVVRQTVPSSIVVRSPIGRLTVRLRNFESMRTLFGIFCRLDYRSRCRHVATYIDVGANIGLASLYFLSRNRSNIVHAFEPDDSNIDFLRTNLLPFGERANLHNCAVTADDGEVVLYRAPDGKHSSLMPSHDSRACLPQRVVARSFNVVLKEASENNFPVVAKLDVEGLETTLIHSVRFENFPKIRRLLCESTKCASIISRPHRCTVRNGYIEDIWFVSP